MEETVYRYERKFIADSFDSKTVENIILSNPAIFKEVYEPRYINNIYLDSFDFRHYYENVNGIDDRLKVRVRWYGEKFHYVLEPNLEFKIKKGVVGTKKLLRLKSFCLKEDFYWKSYVEGEAKKLTPLEYNELLSTNPVVFIRYLRKYYISACNRFRITIDTKIVNSKFGLKSIGVPTNDLNGIVIELKYNECYDEYSKWISNHFPFRLEKNSKYVSAVNMFWMC